MAQVTEHGTTPPRRIGIDAKSEDVAVSLGANDILLEQVISEAARMVFEVKNEGANALDAFRVSAKFHKDGNYVLLFSVAGDFTSPAGLVVDASGDLTTLAAGTTGWLVLDVLGLYKIKIEASSAVGATTVDIFSRAV